MKYIIKFLTEKGVEAYKEIKGKKTSLKDRLVLNKVFKEKEIQNKPYTVIEIKVTLPYIAVQIELDKLIIGQMEKRDCKQDIDFTLEVE